MVCLSLPKKRKILKSVKLKGGEERMKNSTIAIQRAAKLLEGAIRLVFSLKATGNSNPLKVVVLDKLEADLRELDAVLKEELQKNLLDDAKCWSLSNALFKKVTNYLYKSLTNTLLCKYFLLRQKLIYKYDRGVLWRLERH